MLADAVQQHVSAICGFFCREEGLGGCSAGHVEGHAEGDGFTVLCRVDVVPQNHAHSRTGLHQGFSLHRLELPSD